MIALVKTDPLYNYLYHTTQWKAAFYGGLYGQKLDSVQWLFANEHFCNVKDNIRFFKNES